MLDTDNTTTTTDTTSGTPAHPEDAAARPAPRKRAPRKATAPAGPPAADTSAPAAEAAAPAPRKRAPRKAKATAAPPAESVTETPAEAAVEAEAVAPAKKTARRSRTKPAVTEADSAEAVTPDATPALEFEPPAAAPAKKAARKRAAKKTAPAPEQEAGVETAAEAAPAAPGVLFVAPVADTPAPRRRRPAKKTAVVEPSPDETTPLEDDETQTVLETDDADDAATADPDDVREAAIEQANGARRRRRRGRRGRGGAASRTDDADDTPDSGDEDETATDDPDDGEVDSEAGDESADQSGTSRRRRRRRRSGSGGDAGSDSSDGGTDDPPNTVVHVRDKKSKASGNANAANAEGDDGVRGIKGSTRLEAKRQRRRDGRETTRRRAPILTESEFLARREAVDRVMAVRQSGDRTQIAVLEDDILVEHYVTRASATSYVGNVYLGRVQNVLPSMEAAFIDIGKGRNGVLYAGEVNWDAAGLDGKSRAIEQAMHSGDPVLVQVTKDPIGHKGARLTSQVSLPGRFVVYVPGGGMTGISRRLPDAERHRLKSILKKIVPDEAGVIVRTAAEGASEEDLTRDVERLQAQWEQIQQKSEQKKAAPVLLHGEPDLAIRVVRDVFNEDFKSLVVQGSAGEGGAWDTISDYVGGVAPDLAERVSKHVGNSDLFHDLRVDEQLMKALDRKVWLPSGGSLVIDRTEAMTVIDVNTGKFIGSGGNLEQTVTRNNLEAAEEIVRQLRLRDVGGIVVVDFIDMVLESNRDLVLRRLTECLGRDRTKHQVAEITSLGLVQMTRKRVGEGLLEAFSEPCEHCHGRGLLIHQEPVEQKNGGGSADDDERGSGRSKRRRGGKGSSEAPEVVELPMTDEQRQAANAAIAAIHKAAALEKAEGGDDGVVAALATDLVAAAREAEVETSTGDAPETAPPEIEQAAVAVAEGPTTAAPAEGTNVTPPARRRRRAASRPAGPPVATV